MSEKDNLSIYLRLGVITLILFVINIGVYFLCFYKPYDLITTNVYMPEIASVNQSIKDMNRDNLIFFSIFSFIICIFVSYIIVIFITPVTEVNAKLKSKEMDSKINVSLRGGGATRVNTYKLTFELDNGDEMSFPVYDKHYVTILEGNKGIMKYKKGLVNRYVGFYVKEVE